MSNDVNAELQSYHPEFGYLCPSPQLRRKVRSVVLTVAAALTIAAGTALALMPQLAPPASSDETRGVSALSGMTSSTVMPAISANAGGAAEPLPLATANAAAVTDRVAGARVAAACDDPSGAFLAPQCQLGKVGRTGKSHMMRAARAAAARVATVPVERDDAGLEGAPQNAAAAPPSRPAEAPASAVATNEELPLSPAKPEAPAKKPIHRKSPIREVANAGPPPAAPSSGFDLFALFHEPSRSGSSAWAMSRPPRPVAP